MNSSGALLQSRRYRAPRRDGQTFFDPAWESAAAILDDNASKIKQYGYSVQGRSIQELSRSARIDLIAQAKKYTLAYRDVDSPDFDVERSPIVLAGHQPQLPHPGVWFKNFALADLAARKAAQGVNLLIDNDLLRTASIRAPSGTADQPILEQIPFDQSARETPFEQRPILDHSLFNSFGERVKKAVAPLGLAPLIGQLWPLAIESSKQTDNLGCVLAQARHKMERLWGLSTLELPLSFVCDAEAFHWFLVHILAQLPRFHRIYNDSLAEYRRANRIRSRSHPVPDLSSEDSWFEAPFWIWSNNNDSRRRLFVRTVGNAIEITDRDQFVQQLPLNENSAGDAAVEQIGRLRSLGIKIRPRALLTTMYSRLFLGDLFMHGIGGGKYDQLTDLIIQRFFQLDPPVFMVLTATAMLPISRPSVGEDDLQLVTRDLRMIQHHPERFLDNSSKKDAQVGRWIAQKQDWIAQQPPRGEALERHRGIQLANEALRNHTKPRRDELLARRSGLVAALRKEKLLSSRDFSFCLFPEKNLRSFLLEFFARAT